MSLSNHKNNKIYIKLFLFVVSIALYVTTLNHGFTLDDALVLTENKFTQNADYYALLTQDTFSGFLSESSSSDLIEGGRYRPLTLVIFAVLWQISDQPFIYHLINVLLFAVTVVLIFSVVNKLLEQSKVKSVYVGAWTALLFAAHPVHTEVVNNIKSLDEILSLILSLLAWQFLLKHAENKSLKLSHHLSVIVIFIMALMAKETAVVFLPIIGLGFYVCQQQTLKISFKRTLPLLVGLGIYLLCRTSAIGDLPSGVASNEPLNNPFLKLAGTKWVAFSLSEQLGTIAYVMNKYLSLMLFPLKLTHDYYPSVIPITPINAFSAVFSLLTHGLLVLLAVYGSSQRKFYGFAIGLYLIALMLFSNLIFTIGTFMAERFLYVPSLGFCMFLAWSMAKIAPQNTYNQFIYKHPISIVLHGLILIMVLFWGYKVIDRSQDWKSNLSLFKADQITSKHSAKLQNALGGELTFQSQTAEIKNTRNEQIMLEEAISHLNTAIKIHPTYALAFMIKGNALHYQGNHQQAIESYQQAIKIKPNYSDARNNLQQVAAIIESQLTNQSIATTEAVAFLAIEEGNSEKAMLIFSQLIDQHQLSKHYFFRGVTYANNQRYKNALHDFEKAEAIALTSDSENIVNIWQALVNVHHELGNGIKASVYQDKIKQFGQN